MWLFVNWLVVLTENSTYIYTYIFPENKYWLEYREIRNPFPTHSPILFSKIGFQVVQASLKLYIVENDLEPLVLASTSGVLES